MIAWIEFDGYSRYVHLQTLRIASNNGVPLFGFNSWYTGQRDATNHRTLFDIDNSSPNPLPGARVSLQLDSDGAHGALMTYAFEGKFGTKYGMPAGQYQFPTVNRVDLLRDLDGIIYKSSKWASTHNGDIYPVIISYPLALGYDGRLCVYYLSTQYAAGTRVVEFDYTGGGTIVLPTGTGDYTYTSLQGAPNPSGASFALVAGGLDNSSNAFVNYYV